MKILISAAETSSDAHGAELLRNLKEQLPSHTELEVFGIGGPKLQAMGLRTIVDARELMAMGFVEILSLLPRIMRALRSLTQAARETRPDIAIVIDYPDFHFRLAKRLKRLGIPLIYYIPPKVWVWRKKRINLLKDSFKKILCILPFEEEFYKKENISATYVGNPLMDELPFSLTRLEARTRLGLTPQDRVAVLMPGSRKSELKHHLELMLEAAILTAKDLRSTGFLGTQEKLKILMPFPTTSHFQVLKERVDRFMSFDQQEWIDVRISQGNSHECLVAADAGLIKSGTSTLEAGLLKCPHSIVYKPGLTSQWIFKYLIRYQGPVGLVNLVAGWKSGEDYLVNEVLCENVTLETLKQEFISILTDPEKRKKQITGFEKLLLRMRNDSETQSPSRRAAQEILRCVSIKGN